MHQPSNRLYIIVRFSTSDICLCTVSLNNTPVINETRRASGEYLIETLLELDPLVGRDNEATLVSSSYK